MRAIRLGIDFGATRTVVATIRDGCPSLVEFVQLDGEVQPWHPAIIAAKGEDCVTGLHAKSQEAEDGWRFLRSPGRLLTGVEADAPVVLGEASQTSRQWVVRYLTGLRQDLFERTALEFEPDEPIAAAISIPSNADGSRRFLTLEAFHDAGFRVLDMLERPAATRIECTRSRGGRSASRPAHMLIYDLGEESFDGSLIRISEGEHEVLASAEIAGLGGGQLDRALLDLVMERVSPGFELAGDEATRLLARCREIREGLHPNTRRIVVPMAGAMAKAMDGAGKVVFSADDFLERCQPLIARTLETVDSLLAQLPDTADNRKATLDCVHVTGGASEFPAVIRALRRRFGRRVERAPDPWASTALGLATAAARERDQTGGERFERHFGMWREADSGGRKAFDPIFHKGTRLPAAGEAPLVVTRRYRPGHNIGYLRYLDCGELREDGLPICGVTPWEEVTFPFDPSLKERSEFSPEEVMPADHLGGQEIEERYTCSLDGQIELSISNLSAGYSRSYLIRCQQPDS